MPPFLVRAGAQLAHQGRIYPAGAIVDLPRKIAAEIPHLVDEVDASGRVLDRPLPGWQISLETVRQHERVSILEMELAAATTQLQDAQSGADAADQAAEQAHAGVTLRQQLVTEITQALQQERAALDVAEADDAATAAAATAASKRTTKKDKSQTAPSGHTDAPAEAGPSSEEK